MSRCSYIVHKLLERVRIVLKSRAKKEYKEKTNKFLRTQFQDKQPNSKTYT